MKTRLCVLLLLVAVAAQAETERVGVVTPDRPFDPTFYLFNRELGLIWQLEGGAAVGPTRILPGTRSAGLPPTMPVLPMLPSGPSYYERNSDFQRSIIDSLDDDFNRLIRLTE